FYALLSMSISLWAAGIFMHAVTIDPDMCLFWGRFSHIGASFVPIFYLLFVIKLIKSNVNIKYLSITGIAIACLYSILAFHSLFFTGVSPKIGLRQWADPGILYPIFAIYFLILPVITFCILIFSFKHQTPVKKNQLGYIIIASLLCYAGGIGTFFAVYNFKIFFVHPYGLYFVSAYNLIITYAIIRHKLLDIEVIVKKTLVFAGLFGFVFTIIIMAALLTQEFIAKYIPHSRYLALAISAVIIVLLQQPVYNFLISLTNKYLFQKKYDARTMLKDFSNKALTILNLDTLCNVTIEALVRHLCLSNCAILLLSKEDVGYQVYNAAGVDGRGVYFDSKSSLVQALKANYQPLLYQSRNKSTQASEPVKKDMEKIKSMACLPLVIHNEMVGILSLGAKKSDQPYDENDIDIITTLMKALSIAISNAKLFMQASQCEKLAAIGTLASAVNHEVCNPLNRISIQIQAYILNKKAKPFENRDLENQFKEVEKIMYDIMSEIQKVANITGKLSNFAKPKKIVDSKPINIKESVKDTLNILGHKLQSDRIHIEENIPLDLPDIIADKDQMQEIFFNLIKNAAEAIKEKGCILITAKEDNNKVKIEVTDSGCGIPEDKLDKIFEPFVTTKTDGSGYGLAVVREIILRNKGSITARNNAGGGSTFCLEFPKA
ncbi:GAF domain-containing protein, partial [bacterium]|nr:GAF domain-containing protein [bacterium]